VAQTSAAIAVRTHCCSVSMEHLQSQIESWSLATQEVVEPRPPWLEVKDGFDWCSLCRLFATDAHLSSERHIRRASWYKCHPNDAYTWRDPCEGPPESWGHPDQFEWCGGWWRCRVCNQWADGCHVQGKKHQWRTHWADWYLLYDAGDRRCNAITCDETSRVPMLEAGTEHLVKNAGVTQREVKPDPWGPDWEASVKASDGKSAKVKVLDVQPAERSLTSQNAASWEAWRPTTEAEPQQRSGANAASCWRRTWSVEHKRSYFWHTDTGERRWDLPAGVADERDVEWSP